MSVNTGVGRETHRYWLPIEIIMMIRGEQLMKIKLLALLLASTGLNQASADAMGTDTDTPSITQMAHLLALYPNGGMPNRTMLLARMLHNLAPAEYPVDTNTPQAYPGSDRALRVPLVGQHCCIAAINSPSSEDGEVAAP